MPKTYSDIGLIGLAVMGQNLALNIADHGFQISVYNRTTEKTDKFAAENRNTPGGLIGTRTLEEFVQSLAKPRRAIILVQAGKATDAVIDSLVPLFEKDDIIIDGGNALWTDTIRREKALREKGLRFIGSGVSGGEEGARFGPALMPGGDRAAYKEIEPIWNAVAAKVDAKSGRPLTGAAPGKPIKGGVPCAAYIGENGAGHYVKMVHNGIEYGDMQMICESYDLMKRLLGLKAPEMGAIFSEWNQGMLGSFLIEITADILNQKDPVTRKPIVDVILYRRPERHRQVDLGQRTRHGCARADDCRVRFRPMRQRDQGRARRGVEDPEGPGEEISRFEKGAHRGDSRCAVLLKNLLLRAGFPAHA